MKNKLLLGTAAVVIVGSSFALTSAVGAQNVDTSSSVITKLAQKFNLKETDVKAVFDEAHNERHAQMQKNREEKLAQAVKDGKITESQKAAIANKLKEMQAQKQSMNKDSLKGMTAEERKAAMQKKHEELNAWAQENGLSLETIQSLIGGPFHKGFGKRMIMQ